MVLKEMKVGGWQFNVSTHQEIFPVEAIKHAQNLLSRWVKVFPREGTWVERTYGVPSILLRLDCVWDEVCGALRIYEIEERPAGVGIASLVNPDFRMRAQALMKIWPTFDVVLSPFRGEKNDDYLWRRVKTLPEVLNEDGLVLVRAEPNETEFHYLRSRSVAPISHKGLKGYGVHLGFWREVTSPEELPWEEGFVLKPFQGSKMKNVEIWHPRLRKEVIGVSTRKKVEETLSRCGKMYLQPFFSPMRRGELYVIYRVFFGYDPVERRYSCLGGVWNGRPNQLRIHGASDAIFGSLVLEESERR